ncbi:hypothetical protein SALBM135S_01152 [Streptomyces alboniger]
MKSSTAAHGSALTEVWPLSPLQEGLLFHSDFDDRGPDVYAVQFTVSVEGPLDAARLRASWEALLDRHAALRASFHRRKTGKRYSSSRGTRRCPGARPTCPGPPIPVPPRRTGSRSWRHGNAPSALTSPSHPC